MKKIKFLAIFLCLIICFSFTGCNLIIYEELGNPQLNRYSNDYLSRCSQDMIYYNGYIYFGGGNYDTNSGPVDIWRYSIEEQTFELSGTVYDEEISRFYIFNDTLYACGTDPKDVSWDIGGYYYLDNQTDSWQTVRNIDNAVHNFDLAYFNNKLFAGLGVETGIMPASVSTDNGITFTPIDFYKTTKLNTSNWDNDLSTIRVYDFFEFNGELFADLYLNNGFSYSFEIFKYENNSFNGYSTFPFYMKLVSNLWINGKCEYNGNYYISSGVLFVTNDMKNFSNITPNNETTCSLKIFDNQLYLLTTSSSVNQKYYNKIYKFNDNSKSFEEVFTFTYYAPAISFCKLNNDFYISIGTMFEKFSYNGNIIKISL